MPAAFTQTFLSRTATCFQGKVPQANSVSLLQDSNSLILIPDSDIRGEAEKAGIVQPGEEMAQGDLLSVRNYMIVGSKEDRARLLSGA